MYARKLLWKGFVQHELSTSFDERSDSMTRPRYSQMYWSTYHVTVRRHPAICSYLNFINYAHTPYRVVYSRVQAIIHFPNETWVKTRKVMGGTFTPAALSVSH